MKQSRKIITMVLLCLMIAFPLTGCNDKPVNSGQGGKDIVQNGLKEWEGVRGKVIKESYPAEIVKYLEDNMKKETQQAFNINNRTYLVLTMGQQPSAGHSVELKNIILKDGTLKVLVKYEKPGKNDMVAEVITYPTLVIETDDIYEGHYEILYEIEK